MEMFNWNYYLFGHFYIGTVAAPNKEGARYKLWVVWRPIVQIRKEFA